MKTPKPLRPSSKIERLLPLLKEALTLAPTPDGHVSLKAIKEQHPELFKSMLALANGNVKNISSYQRKLFDKGYMTAGIPDNSPRSAVAPVVPPAKPGVRRQFSNEFKAQVVARLAAGEKMSALVAELGVVDSRIYGWRAALKKKANKLAVGAPATPQPVVLTMPGHGADFCPHCGFPIAMINKTVNTIKQQAR